MIWCFACVFYFVDDFACNGAILYHVITWLLMKTIQCHLRQNNYYYIDRSRSFAWTHCYYSLELKLMVIIRHIGVFVYFRVNEKNRQIIIPHNETGAVVTNTIN